MVNQDIQLTSVSDRIADLKISDIRNTRNLQAEILKPSSFILARPLIAAQKLETVALRSNAADSSASSPSGSSSIADLSRILRLRDYSTIFSTGLASTPKQYPIYSYLKQLISQKVLGKQLSVTLSVSCSMTVYGKNSKDSRNKISCSSDLILNIAGKINKIHLYDLNQTVKNWAANKNFGGNWGVGFVVPLPPPVSFIQISFNFAIGYSVGLGVYVKVYGAGLLVGSYVSTALTTSAEVGIRVGIAEGGAYVSGTLVSLKTEPTLAINFVPNALNGKIDWQLTLNAFSFNWGLYYKWCYFFGCWKRNSITSWKISQGLTKNWSIYSKAFSINL